MQTQRGRIRDKGELLLRRAVAEARMERARALPGDAAPPLPEVGTLDDGSGNTLFFFNLDVDTVGDTTHLVD